MPVSANENGDERNCVAVLSFYFKIETNLFSYLDKYIIIFSLLMGDGRNCEINMP